MVFCTQGSLDLNSTLCVDPLVHLPPSESPPPLPPDYAISPDSSNGLGPSPITISDYVNQDSLSTPVNFSSSTPMSKGGRDWRECKMDSFESDIDDESIV